jgi:hypothetical protein
MTLRPPFSDVADHLAHYPDALVAFIVELIVTRKVDPENIIRAMHMSTLPTNVSLDSLPTPTEQLSPSYLDEILVAVEFGYRGCEEGKNLQQTLQDARSYYKG